MSRKKTVSIRTLIEKINKQNQESTCSSDVRNGWNVMLESIMMDANVYVGFGYYAADQLPPGVLPGIRPKGDTQEFPDESRRYYYIHSSLRETSRKENT